MQINLLTCEVDRVELDHELIILENVKGTTQSASRSISCR